jgi:hypothetical protein
MRQLRLLHNITVFLTTGRIELQGFPQDRRDTGVSFARHINLPNLRGNNRSPETAATLRRVLGVIAFGTCGFTESV